MAITISGENNNDKILAQDGVIDQISGINIVGLITTSHINVGSNIQLGNAGIITATTFVGNITGNVNNTSPLLLQTGGSERFRITGNNELGIAGANYGSAGQVLTSGGSGNAVTWSAIPTQVTINDNADNRVITGSGSANTLNGESEFTYTGGVLKVAATYPSFYLDDTNTTNNRFRIIHNNQLTQFDADPNNVYAGSFINITIDGSEKVRITENCDIIATSTSAGATGPTLKLFHNSASPAANDVVSRISMVGDDAAGNETVYSRIETIIDDPTNGQETSHIDFSTRGYSAYNTMFRLKRRGTASAPSYTADDIDGIILDVYNTGNPYPRYMNFIAKSAGDVASNIGFWTEAVGGSPTEKLRITSDGKVGFNNPTLDNDFVFKCGTGAHTVMQVRSASESTKFTIQTVQDSDVRVGTVSNHPLNVYTNSLTRVHIHDDGWCMLNTSTLGSSKTAKELIVSYNNDGVSGGDQGRAGITIRSGDNSSNVTQNGYLYFSDGTSGTNESVGALVYEHSNDAMYFATDQLERLRIASDGKIYVKGNGGDTSTNFSDAGTFFNLKHDTYGGRIGFSNGTASAGVTLMEQLGYWGSNKVAGWIMTAGGDTTNRDDGEMSFYTRKSGEGVKERLHIGSEGEVVVGYRVGTSSVRSNQPVAFHSTNITPHGNARRVSTGQRCNLFVGSNSGWSSGDGGVIAMGGSETGGAGIEATWAYVTGKRQSGNGWEYGGYFEVGTSPYSGTVMAKRMRLWANGQMEVYPNDDTFYSTQIGGAQRMIFKHNGGGAIEIKNSNGNMTFTSSSDYRLKKDEVAISNALSTVKALKPYQFTWKSDGKLGQGFFAHEAQAVLPDVGVVSGTKDEVHTNDDTENGGQYKKDDPIYQGIDYSKLVPLLTAALQEETAKREALEARVAALEGS